MISFFLLIKTKFSTDSLSNVDEQFHPEKLVKFEGVITMSAKQKLSTDVVMQKLREVMDERAEQRLKEEMEIQRTLQNQAKDEEQLEATFL